MYTSAPAGAGVRDQAGVAASSAGRTNAASMIRGVMAEVSEQCAGLRAGGALTRRGRVATIIAQSVADGNSGSWYKFRRGAGYPAAAVRSKI